jgi:hypothetical protein
MKQTEERHSESRMRQIRKSGSMRGRCGAVCPLRTSLLYDLHQRAPHIAPRSQIMLLAH